MEGGGGLALARLLWLDRRAAFMEHYSLLIAVTINVLRGFKIVCPSCGTSQWRIGTELGWFWLVLVLFLERGEHPCAVFYVAKPSGVYIEGVGWV